MELLSDAILERSAVVANCRMNRERGLAGSNGYAKEVGFDPLLFLRSRIERDGRASWLDLCSGSGKALVEAASILHQAGLAGAVEIVGVDLIGPARPPGPFGGCLRLVESSLRRWEAERDHDLITCVHGLRPWAFVRCVA